MVAQIAGRVLWGLGRLAMKYVVIPVAVTAATAFVLGGLVERVRHQKNGAMQAQAHLEA